MELSCPLGTTRCIPKERFSRKPGNESFIDHACPVKMAGYWPRSYFLRVYGPRRRRGPLGGMVPSNMVIFMKNSIS